MFYYRYFRIFKNRVKLNFSFYLLGINKIESHRIRNYCHFARQRHRLKLVRGYYLKSVLIKADAEKILKNVLRKLL